MEIRYFCCRQDQMYNNRQNKNNIMTTDAIMKMKDGMLRELTGNILPFWMEKMEDRIHGGFLGRISGKGETDSGASKGAILNARILWTFSAAYRILGKPEYLATATRAKREIIDRFYDRKYGGVYWSLTPEGKPEDRKKQIYALGFAIYGLSEYCRATGDAEALEYAVKLFHDIEYMGELALVVKLPFGAISAYVNHYSSPSKNWNFGLTLGWQVFGTRFME